MKKISDGNKANDSYYKAKYDEAKKLLKEAKEHLEYCGYGDAWERECSLGLQEKLDKYFDKEEEAKRMEKLPKIRKEDKDA